MPPGPAQTSSTRSPGCGSSARTTNDDAWSWTANRPSANPGSAEGDPEATTSESGCTVPRSVWTAAAPSSRSSSSTVVRQVFARIASGARSARAAAARSVSSSEATTRRSSRTAHSASPVRNETARSLAPSGSWGSSVANRRRTALTNPRCRWSTRATVSETAAWAGTRR